MLTLDRGGEPQSFKFNQEMSPLDHLRPGSKHHEYVLNYLLRRVKISEDEMKKFYSRWRIAEAKNQAYLNLPKYEQILKDMNKAHEPPAPALIVYPYQYAVLEAISTYMMRVFCARKPIFQVGATNKETAKSYRQMEAVLQHQADANKLIAKLYQVFKDGGLYGVGIVRTIWREKKGLRAVPRQPTAAEMLFDKTLNPNLRSQKEFTEVTVFEGNDIENVDPYMFFPDPSVPMCEVAEKGEWVFWRDYPGLHVLLKDEKAGYFKFVSSVKDSSPPKGDWFNLSNRNLMSGGNASAGEWGRKTQNQTTVLQRDQGTVEIIPKELGLGDSEYPEKWIFTILNGKQIVQAEPFRYNHGKHPVSVAEPYTMGYGFGQPGLSDYVSPIQDIISWFVASHIYNVRASLNNMIVYDPSKIEGQDVRNPKPGKLIRVKPAGVGSDIRTMIQQLPVADVTANHMSDLQNFIRIGDIVSAVNDNMRGIVRQGGRQTATEVRVSGESSASRLATLAQLYSTQCITDLANQMCINTQQFQSQGMYVKILGEEQYQEISPTEILGNYIFPIHDGTLPLDKMAAFDIWKEILMGLAGDQELRAGFSFLKLFEYVAELGGAVNISSFRTPMFDQLLNSPPGIMPNQQVEQQVQAGNMVPLNEAPQ